MIDPATRSGASELLRLQGLRPRKRWGQNFLCDRNVLENIAKAAHLDRDTSVLEIGPGLGALTRVLARDSRSVTAVEIDTLMTPILAQSLVEFSNVRLIFADFLRLDTAALAEEAFGADPGIVVANVPYYISTPILERLFRVGHRIRRIVLLLQQEFADRMVAAAGTDDYGAMSVFAQYHARITIVGRVPPTVFLPAPDVGSAIVALEPVTPGTIVVANETLFFQVVRSAFGQRRKTLANAITGGNRLLAREEVDRALLSAEIDAARRAETLTLGEFARLASIFQQLGLSERFQRIGGEEGAASGVDACDSSVS